MVKGPTPYVPHRFYRRVSTTGVNRMVRVLFLPPAQCEHGVTQWAAGVKMCDVCVTLPSQVLSSFVREHGFVAGFFVGEVSADLSHKEWLP